MIVFSLKQPSSLHVLSLSVLVAPYLCKSNQQYVHQGPEVIFDDKDIHSSLGVAKEKVGDLLLNMCSTFQINNYDNILKCIMGYCTFIPIGASK
jgi:hypothetical protein